MKRGTVYPEVEMKIVLYIKLCNNLYTQNEFGMSWHYLQGEILYFLKLEDEPEYYSFACLPEFIQNIFC